MIVCVVTALQTTLCKYIYTTDSKGCQSLKASGDCEQSPSAKRTFKTPMELHHQDI
jgi:hypothetical protein